MGSAASWGCSPPGVFAMWKYIESNFVTKKEANGLSIGRYKKKYRASNLSQKKRQMVSVNEDIRKANSK